MPEVFLKCRVEYWKKTPAAEEMQDRKTVAVEERW